MSVKFMNQNIEGNSDSFWMTKSILDKSKTPFYRHNPVGRIDYVNQAACKSIGYNEEELLGLYPWDIDPDFKPEHWPDVWEKLKKNEIVHINTRHRRKDGSFINVEVTGHYINSGSSEFSFTFVQDVTERKVNEELIRQKESYLRALINNFPFLVWLKDKNSRFLTVNQAYADSYGYQDPDQITGKTDFDLSPLDLAKHYRKDDLAVMESGKKQIIEEHHQGAEGRHWIETYKAPVIGIDGDILGTVGFSKDITERKVKEAELTITAAIFNSHVGMVVTDKENVILKVNEAFTHITGYTPDLAIGEPMSLLSSNIHQASFYQEMWKNIQAQGGWQGEIWNRRSNGEIYPQWLTVTAIKDASGEVSNYVGTMMDITDRKVIEDRMKHLAHYDFLTGLPNRALLMDRLQTGIAHAKRTKSMFSLMYMDLDKFKEVNDTLGHDRGDLLLREVAQRLLKCVKREIDTIARIGGDEFIILLPKIQQVEDIEAIATSILSSMRDPFNLEGNEINISASIGIAIYPNHGEDAKRLIKSGDTALYAAKNNGKNCYKFL
ncbi:hypothetical protein ASG34_07080 [Methylophilus sp. Leaf416]|nr:hypothetical protein ASG34_07080 [Methylophilus sp. Leaf416]